MLHILLLHYYLVTTAVVQLIYVCFWVTLIRKLELQYWWLHSLWQPLTTSSDIIFNFLQVLMFLPKLRSQRH